MGGFRGLSTCFAVIALSACGSYGAGHGYGSGTPTASTAGSASPLVARGTFLAGPGGNFTGAVDSITFSSTTITSAANSSNAAQIALASDPSTGKTRFLTLNIPLGNGTTYQHLFDLAAAGVFASAALNGFIGVQDANMANTLVLDPSLTFSSYGAWVNNATATTGSTGGFAFGNMTPAGGIPTTGTATYSGRTVGAAVNKTSGMTPALVGTATLNANFGTMMVSGSFSINDIQNAVLWGNLSMGSTPIAAATGGAYNGTLTGTLEGGGAVANSDVHGHFFGPTANETAGTWSAANTTWQGYGAFGAKKQ